ncbi:MAG: PilZ domain-containing protein [Candidatus Omnitrophota bacterium]|jgi:c-di-GMP-binding flagellar brake protein YcgR
MSAEYNGPERRKSARIGVKFVVTYQVDRPIDVRMWVGNKQINALMLDLSEQGMAILTKYEIPVSSSLAIKFTLINLGAEKDRQMHSMEIIGEVRYSYREKNEHHLGITFTRISQEDKTAIVSFVQMAMNQ